MILSSQKKISTHIKEVHSSKVSNKKKSKEKCRWCHFAAASKKALRNHYLQMHKNSSKKKISPTMEDFYQKNRITAKNDANTVQTSVLKKDQTNNKRRVESKSCQMKCECCKKVFQHENRFLIHKNECREKHTCTICGLVFQSLNVHMRMHTKKFPFSCDVCHRNFNVKSCLEKHKCSAKWKVRRNFAYCKKCSQPFKNFKLLKIHNKKVHGIEGFECDVCQKQFRCLGSLASHKTRHNKPDKFQFVCEYCGKGYYVKSSWDYHQSSCKKKPLPLTADYVCQYCGKHFHVERSWQYHESSCIKNPLAENYVCAHCGKSFCSKQSLRQHEVRHFSNRNCKEKGVNKIRSHQLLPHTSTREQSNLIDDEPFQCKMCLKIFSMPSKLARHIKAVHSEKKFSCETCGKGFADKGNFARHRRTHTGEMFQCPICSREFKSFSALYECKKRHSGDKKFVCSICSKRFYRNSDLNHHLHWHKGEKPHQCRYCGKRFLYENYCRVHEKASHEGNYAKHCSVCGKGFYMQSYLDKHMLEHQVMK